METFIPVFNARYHDISEGNERVDLEYESQLHENSHQDLLENSFEKDKVLITGKTKSYSSKTDSGSTITRSFCPECGSPLFGTLTNNDNIIGVSAGTMDNSDWFKPGFIVFNKRKPIWDFMDESVPTFDEMP